MGTARQDKTRYRYLGTGTYPDPSMVSPDKAANVPRTPNQVKLWWPSEDYLLWRKFLEMCKRDGHAASEEIREWVRQQVAKRDPGNPQTPLEKYGVEQCSHAWAWVPMEDTALKRWACVSCGTRGPLEELQNR